MSALIIAAPFSAIMIVGALVLVEVTVRITEASTTQPVRGSWSSTAAIRPFCRCGSQRRAIHRRGKEKERAVFAVNLPRLALPVLGLFEIGQQMVPRPAQH